MIASAHQADARHLGAERWRVTVEAPPDVARVAVGGGTVTARAVDAAAPDARVETVAVPQADARERWEMVIALERPLGHGEVGTYDVGGGAGAPWTVRVVLDPHAEEPEARTRPFAERVPRPGVDYTARDFDALREMMLRIIAERVRAPLAGHPVAQSTALVEQIAYLGDALSYEQDALATEAYLTTARRRTSVARHAALLDYELFEGRTARVWVRVEVSEPLVLERGTALAAGATRFETLQDAALEPGERRRELAAAHHAAGRLAPGATRATVLGAPGELEEGELVLLEPASSGSEGPGHVVRLTAVRPAGHDGRRRLTEIEWAAADALPDEPLLTGAPLRVRVGNLVLAEEGTWRRWADLPPPRRGERYRPQLPHRGLAFSAGRPRARAAVSAAAMLMPAGPTWPGVELRERIGHDVRHWSARSSLFASGPMATDFVVEVGDDGTAALRFGDNVNGLRPPPGASFEVRQRIGGGARGNVAPGEVDRVLGDDDRIIGVANPVAARGGAERESLTSARLGAPEAFRITDRAVDPETYVAQARAVEGVADAAAQLASTGSWPVAVVYVHSGDWSRRDEGLVRRVRRWIAARQPAGVALQVRRAQPVAVTVELEVSLSSGWDASAVVARIDRALRHGFLYPGRFGFGDALHRSDVVTTVAAVPGVVDVTPTRFEWYGAPARRPVDTLTPPHGRVIRLDNDPARPDAGSVTYTIGGPA